MQFGYALSSEEHGPRELVALARRAEEAGFSFAFISDHYHPWTDRQGQSPFAWAVIGGIAQATQRISIGTAVTCPTLRLHPAIVAQAAATCAEMLPGRFSLGLGPGENLNEHVVGARWQPPSVRFEALQEAVEIIRLLWQGGSQSHRGRYFEVDRARIYTMPEQLPPILIAASGQRSARLAAEAGDGLIATKPRRDLVEALHAAGGHGKPCYGQIHVCWAPDEAEALAIARAWWPISALPRGLHSDLATPQDFAAAAALVSPEQVAATVICGPDVEKHLAAIRSFDEAGYSHVYLHQVGPDQEGFFRFYQRELLPALRDTAVPAR